MDVLVLMDELALQGYLVKCRPIGIIEGEQGDKKETVRSDREQLYLRNWVRAVDRRSAEIEAKRVKKQKFDREDARLLLWLMRENTFRKIG